MNKLEKKKSHFEHLKRKLNVNYSGEIFIMIIHLICTDILISNRHCYAKNMQHQQLNPY